LIPIPKRLIPMPKSVIQMLRTRTFDQSPPTFFVDAFRDHPIEREHGLQQPLRAHDRALLGDLDPVRVAVRARVHEGKLRSGEILGAELDPTERAQLAGSG
jgi:hypothetical protein